MIRKGLISVLMPVRNAGPYITECLESIIDQTEKNWELIAINDHSSDESSEILHTFSKKDDRIKVFSNDGKGIISALSTAFKLSSGEFIHRMDADDVMAPGKLQKLKALLINNGPGYVSTSPVNYFSIGKVSPGYKIYEKWLNKLCENDDHWNHLYEECVIASPNWMIYRSDIMKTGGFDSNLYPEDYDLVFRMYQSGLNIISTAEVLHLWREHPERTSRSSKNYSQKAFFKLKTHYWLKLEYSNQHILIFGAGIKGKLVAEELKSNNISYTWVNKKPTRQNPELKKILSRKNQKIIVTVGDEQEKVKIKKLLSELELIPNNDFYWFR